MGSPGIQHSYTCGEEEGGGLLTLLHVLAVAPSITQSEEEEGEVIPYAKKEGGRDGGKAIYRDATYGTFLGFFYRARVSGIGMNPIPQLADFCVGSCERTHLRF